MTTPILKLSILFIFLSFSKHTVNFKTKISSCCKINGGRCTGSANCSACTNCSGCKYCNSGGTCGVCSSGKSTRVNNSDSYLKHRNSSSNNNSNSTNRNTQVKTAKLKLVVTSTELKFRSGPGTEYEEIENLTLGDQLIYINKENGWIYVENEEGINGYVFYKFVKFID